MAEIGLIASVVQVAGTGLKLSQTLYQYVDGVTTADRRIRDVAKEIELTSIVVEELGEVFKLDETSTLMSKKAFETADQTMKECSSVFAEIDETLGKSKKNTFGRLMLPFRDSKIELLRSHIDKLKSSLSLLMHVLSYAHQVAAKKLDREAEDEAKAQIQELIDLNKKSAEKYRESLQDFDMNDGVSGNPTLVDSPGAVSVGQIVPPDPTANIAIDIKAIGSSVDPRTLETCVQHVRSLLNSIETLQQALMNAVDGADHSAHHQTLVDSYFRARGHLDGVIFSGRPKQSPSIDNQPRMHHSALPVDVHIMAEKKNGWNSDSACLTASVIGGPLEGLGDLEETDNLPSGQNARARHMFNGGRHVSGEGATAADGIFGAGRSQVSQDDDQPANSSKSANTPLAITTSSDPSEARKRHDRVIKDSTKERDDKNPKHNKNKSTQPSYTEPQKSVWARDKFQVTNPNEPKTETPQLKYKELHQKPLTKRKIKRKNLIGDVQSAFEMSLPPESKESESESESEPESKTTLYRRNTITRRRAPRGSSLPASPHDPALLRNSSREDEHPNHTKDASLSFSSVDELLKQWTNLF